MQSHMQPNEVVKYIDKGILVTAGCFSVLAAFGAIYASPWSKCTPKQGPSTEYNSIWGVRVCLQVTAFFWLLAPVLQHHEIWTPTFDVLEMLGVSGHVPCQVYLSARLGLFEPFFLFLGLFAFEHWLRQGQGWEMVSDAEMGDTKGKEEHVNRWIIGKAFLCTLPIFGVQTFVSLLTELFPDKVDDDSHYIWISSSEERNGCDLMIDQDPPSSGCVVCIYPIVSSIFSLLFIICYTLKLNQKINQMMNIALNQSLKQRINVFRCGTLLLMMGVVCRGVTVIMEPRTVLFEILRLGDFLSAAFFVMASSYTLVLRPVHDTRIADKTAGRTIALTRCFSSQRMGVRKRASH